MGRRVVARARTRAQRRQSASRDGLDHLPLGLAVAEGTQKTQARRERRSELCVNEKEIEKAQRGRCVDAGRKQANKEESSPGCGR